jgi:hypothetical protein
MDFHFVIPRFINNFKKKLLINISINEYIYHNSRFKQVKFSNFEALSPNLVAPLALILFSLLNFKFQFDFHFIITSFIDDLK